MMSSRFRLAAGAISVAAAIGVCGCGAAARTSAAGEVGSASGTSPGTATVTTSVTRTPRPRPAQPSYPPFPVLLDPALRSAPSASVPVVRLHGRTAAWIARSAAGTTLLSFDQRLVVLRLHSGTIDAGASGWHWGPEVTGAERRGLAAAFNGGFKLSTNPGGFVSYSRIGASLRDGLGSIVTYADRHSDIGSWHLEVPAPNAAVASVRQNLPLLIDHGRPASTLDCQSCWGATLGGVSNPARSALGITAGRRLVWAGGEHLTVAQLADDLLGAGVVRAVELDINPQWVAGYLYGHRRGAGPLVPAPVVSGQAGVSGFFLTPYSRDFFTIVARTGPGR